MIFVLMAIISQKKYYVTDLQGSLSRSVQDSMIFFNNIVAESYVGPIEFLLEESTGRIVNVKIMSIALSGVIPRTAIECIPSP